jgi:hypothetical protein
MAPDPEAAGGGQAEPPDEEEDDPDVDEVDPTGRYLRVRACSAARRRGLSRSLRANVVSPLRVGFIVD